MFDYSILTLCLILYSILIALACYRLGRKEERFTWYKFMRDDLRPDNAANIQAIAKGVMTAMENGFLPEFLAELTKQTR